MPCTVHMDSTLIDSQFIVRAQPTSQDSGCPEIDMETESGTSTIAAICVFGDRELALRAILDTRAGQVMAKETSSFWIDSMSLAVTAISCRISGCSIKEGSGGVQEVFATITDAARSTLKMSIEQAICFADIEERFCLLWPFCGFFWLA